MSHVIPDRQEQPLEGKTLDELFPAGEKMTVTIRVEYEGRRALKDDLAVQERLTTLQIDQCRFDLVCHTVEKLRGGSGWILWRVHEEGLPITNESTDVILDSIQKLREQLAAEERRANDSIVENVRLMNALAAEQDYGNRLTVQLEEAQKQLAAEREQVEAWQLRCDRREKQLAVEQELLRQQIELLNKALEGEA